MMISIHDLAAEYGIGYQAMFNRAVRLGLPIHHRLELRKTPNARTRKAAGISEESAKKLRAIMPRYVDLEAYMTAEDAARELNVTRNYLVNVLMPTLKGRVRTGKLRTYSAAVGYNRADIRAVAKERNISLRRTTLPEGHLTGKQIAERVNLSKAVLTLWVKEGAPHGTLRNGSHYYKPAALLAWREARPLWQRSHAKQRDRTLTELRKLVAQLDAEQAASHRRAV